jgi:hypothetical protein
MTDPLILKGVLYPKKCGATLIFDLNKVVYVDRALVGNIWLLQFPDQNDKIPVFCKEMMAGVHQSNLIMLGREQWFAPDAVVGMALHQGKTLVIFVQGAQKPIAIGVAEGTPLQEVYDSILEKLNGFNVLDDLDLPTDVTELRPI